VECKIWEGRILGFFLSPILLIAHIGKQWRRWICLGMGELQRGKERKLTTTKLLRNQSISHVASTTW
jgi:hypothetical protein